MASHGMDRRTISRRGQLTVPESLESDSIVTVDEPAVWGTHEDGTVAVLSRTRDVIDTHPELTVAGTSVPDATGTVAVPVPVFETVAGIEPRETVVFVSTQALRARGAVAVVSERQFVGESKPVTSLARLEQVDGS
ncbi:hypothetical protein OB955_10640 [Halobacteria archaeon AArc-m2/3/4]|uniref:SpoVT-AbrB domain-containing protein n=1 Tax=Natronoglomus mannanivorans TaxID=2979990 RepID=A0ABT2QE36_9EURY|nr:hypothetical protein [Halobacteria archaeon AArc-m2/3/4]